MKVDDKIDIEVYGWFYNTFPLLATMIGFFLIGILIVGIPTLYAYAYSDPLNPKPFLHTYGFCVFLGILYICMMAANISVMYKEGWFNQDGKKV